MMMITMTVVVVVKMYQVERPVVRTLHGQRDKCIKDISVTVAVTWHSFRTVPSLYIEKIENIKNIGYFRKYHNIFQP